MERLQFLERIARYFRNHPIVAILGHRRESISMGLKNYLSQLERL
jgi:hypothetical protein